MKTEYIPSGEYFIAKNEPLILRALLGCCVGVALYDRKANVGGIIHLLLPKSSGSDASWKPISYADPGLSLFIDSLKEAGADRENLVAVIAGGALFGAVSQMDINLNIGGRTIEKVLTILSAKNIPVIHEETSGFCPSILQLNTKNWKTDIQTTFDEPTLQPKTIPKLSQIEIDEAINNIVPIPQAALKVIRLVRDDDYHMDEISKTLMADQVLGAKILRLCNSAIFGTVRKISSLQEALLIIGEGHLVEVVVAAAIESFMSQNKSGYSMLRGGLYRHALAVAHAAKVLSEASGKADPGTAYTAGLLHDIGKVVLDQYFTHFKPAFYQEACGDLQDITEMEFSYLGISHQEAGKRLAENWSLPDTIINVIANHHSPEITNDFEPQIVYIADLLASWFLSGMECEKIYSNSLVPSMKNLDLNASQLPTIIEKVPWGELMYI